MTRKKSRGSGGKKKTPKYRSAENGQYVTKEFAKKHPKTTVKESK